MSPHARAVVQALAVTFLWSTSWVLIKIGLEDVPALTFAGLRYALAAALLLPLLLRREPRRALRRLRRRDWLALGALGVVLYTVTQGAQFLALAYLPAQTTSLLLSFSPALVAFAGLALLGERPGGRQFVGIAVFVLGAGVFLYPATFPPGQRLGLAVAAVALLANAGAALLGRSVNRRATLSPLLVTVVSMTIGGVLLLVVGVAVQGLPHLGARSWLIVAWLAVVNTAFAFTLWNRTLRRLSATESSVVNNTMLIQIALLAWLFLGESLDVRQGLGLLLAAAGTLLVQLGAGGRPATPSPTPRRQPE